MSHGDQGGQQGAITSYRGPDDAVLGDQIATVASEVEGGCGAERRQAEQEGELDRRGDDLHRTASAAAMR